MIGIAARPTLLAPDRALPARDELLDADLMSGRLAAMFGIGCASSAHGTRARAKYRIGESLRVVHHVCVAHEPDWPWTGGSIAASEVYDCAIVSGRTFAAESIDDAFRAACARVRAPGGVALDQQAGAVWWRFPADRRLDDVDALLRPADHFAAREPSWNTSEVVEYAPERSLTLRALDPSRSVVGYAKLYAPGTDVATNAARSEALAAALAPHGQDLARVRWVDGSRALMFQSAVPGVAWSRTDADLPSVIAALGEAIALLHRFGLDAVSGSAARLALGRFARYERARVAKSGRVAAAGLPSLAERARTLAAALEVSRPRPEDDVVLHGDCHPKNALIDGTRLTLIDLDQCGLGEPAADLGSLIARLRHGARLGEFAGASVETLVRSALAGYASVRPLPSVPSLRWYTAAAMLVERAVRAINRVHDRSLPGLGDVLGEAQLILDRRDDTDMWTSA
jgi:Ser/Thr protein kinase RdoA (MazF antagonist)